MERQLCEIMRREGSNRMDINTNTTIDWCGSFPTKTKPDVDRIRSLLESHGWEVQLQKHQKLGSNYIIGTITNKLFHIHKLYQNEISLYFSRIAIAGTFGISVLLPRYPTIYRAQTRYSNNFGMFSQMRYLCKFQIHN